MDPAETYQVQKLRMKNASPLSKTNDQMNNTATSEWKSKLSPRARGRIQIALPTENATGTDFNMEVASRDDRIADNHDLKLKKEFAQTGNFPAKKRKGLHSGEDQHRVGAYNNATQARVSPVAVAKMHESDYGNFGNRKGLPKMTANDCNDIMSHEQPVS